MSFQSGQVSQSSEFWWSNRDCPWVSGTVSVGGRLDSRWLAGNPKLNIILTNCSFKSTFFEYDLS